MSLKVILFQAARISVLDLYDQKVPPVFIDQILDGKIPARFFNWLQGNTDPCLLIVDVPSEEIQSDVLTVMGRSDRRQYIRMLRRKHQKAHCLSKVDVVAAITGKVVQKLGISDDETAALIKALVEHDCLIQSVHSPVTLAGALARKINANNCAIFVISIDRESYRLVACIGTRLVLSRSVFTENQNTDANIIADNLRESLIYLRRQADSEWSAPVVYTFSKHFAERLQKNLSSTGDDGLRIDSLEFSDQASSINPVNYDLIRLVHKAPSQGYRLPIKQNIFLMRRLRHAIAGMAASLLVGVTAMAGVNDRLLVEYESLSQEHIDIENIVDDASEFLDDKKTLNVEAVRQALATAKLVDIRSQVSPMPFLYGLSENKANNKTVQIYAVDWQRQDGLDLQILRDLDKTDANNISVDTIYRATVLGAVHGDLDDAMTSFDSFLLSLRKANIDSNVIVIDTPFGLSDQSRTTDKDIAGGDFSVEVTTSVGGFNDH